jgi:uncharacterized SAM-binding protein YcdF (DUF218 family)
MPRGLGLLLLLLIVGFGVAGVFLFLGRDDDALAKADAVVVLAGGEERLPKGISLVQQGIAPVLVVSEDSSGNDEARVAFCARPELPRVKVICRGANPFSTRGEARMIAQLVDREGWDSIVVVTSRYHLLRAKRLIGRCTDAEIIGQGVRDPVWQQALAVPLEWTKLALSETFRRGC